MLNDSYQRYSQAKAYIKRHEGQLQERLAQSKSTRDIYARFNILMNTVSYFLYFFDNFGPWGPGHLVDTRGAEAKTQMPS